MADDMDIPEPWTCGDCVHWRRCSALIGDLRGDEKTCDYAPSRFKLDAIGTLCRLVESAGATVTLYGKPVNADELRDFATTAAVARMQRSLPR